MPDCSESYMEQEVHVLYLSYRHVRLKYFTATLYGRRRSVNSNFSASRHHAWTVTNMLPMPEC